ncbi:MAG: hypothetical protein QW552_09035 [Ignisphaera sp.]|uniref:Uncharacterized protein n=1 Tax=Ignisphaera aggregans TaxID=334771 RepID=A0A7C4NLZ6_9CREN
MSKIGINLEAKPRSIPIALRDLITNTKENVIGEGIVIVISIRGNIINLDIPPKGSKARIAKIPRPLKTKFKKSLAELTNKSNNEISTTK